MKIGVLGAPGVEKSKFARALGREYGLKLIDNYVPALQKKTGLAFGPWSNYSELLTVAGVRRAAELAYQDRITVGTVLDSIVYAACHADVSLQHNGQDQNLYHTAQVVMQGFAVWYEQSYDYDIAFYLPYSGEQKQDIGKHWMTALNAAYPIIFETIPLVNTYTLAGDTASRIKAAKEVVKIVQEAEATEAE